MKYTLFLRWWLFTILILVSHIFAFNLGLFHEIWDQDATKLSFVIIAMFFYMTCWCGSKTWRVSQFPRDHNNRITNSMFLIKARRMGELAQVGWFMSDLFLTLGMIGTIIGFVFMFSGDFAKLDISNAQTAQIIMAKIALGMATALYTTLVGLVYSAILKIQYFNLDLYLEECKNKEG